VGGAYCGSAIRMDMVMVTGRSRSWEGAGPPLARRQICVGSSGVTWHRSEPRDSWAKSQGGPDLQQPPWVPQRVPGRKGQLRGPPQIAGKALPCRRVWRSVHQVASSHMFRPPNPLPNATAPCGATGGEDPPEVRHQGGTVKSQPNQSKSAERGPVRCWRPVRGWSPSEPAAYNVVRGGIPSFKGNMLGVASRWRCATGESDDRGLQSTRPPARCAGGLSRGRRG